MNLIETLQLWQRLASPDTTAESWKPENVFGFFQGLPATGGQLEQALLPLPNGSAILERMQAVYSVADAAPDAAYFIVREPVPIDLASAERLVACFLGNVSAIAEHEGCGELLERLARVATRTVAGRAPRGQQRHDTEMLLYEMLDDWFASLIADPPWVAELDEAFYSVGCDYSLARHLMWPWYAGNGPVTEPYQPYFQLWLHGIDFRFVSESSIVIFVPH